MQAVKGIEVCFGSLTIENKKIDLLPSRRVVLDDEKYCNVASSKSAPIFCVADNAFPFRLSRIKLNLKKNLTVEKLLYKS